MSNPGVYKYRKGVADAQYNLAQLLLIQGDTEGLIFLDGFQKTLVNALIVDPNNEKAIDLLLAYTNNIAEILGNAKYYPEAVNCLEQAKQLLEGSQGSVKDHGLIEGDSQKAR